MIEPDPPKVDPRGEPEVLSGIQSRLPGYVAGWQPAEGSAADAVQRIGAGFAAILARGLNDAVPRAQLAFLDNCGEERLPAQPARATVVFTLSQQSPGDAPLPAGTRIAATASATGGTEPPVFTVTQSIAIVRARLSGVYSLDPGADRWDDHTADLADGFTLFEGRDVVEHAIYLGHDHLFKLPASAKIILSFSLVEKSNVARRELRLKWEYRAADGWRPLAGSIAEMLITDGQVDLRKEGGPAAAEYAVFGRTTYWLRGSLIEPLVPGDPGGLPAIDSVRASLNFGRSDLRADTAFLGDAPLDVSAPFFPFGPAPTRGATFALGSSDAFGRPGARVTIDLTFANLSLLVRAKATLTWEYFDGESWKDLGVVDTTHVLLDTSAENDDNAAKPRDGLATFIAPADWKPTTIGGVTSHFLRVRLDADNVFGTPPGFTTTAPIQYSPGSVKPPMIRSLRISYVQLTEPTPVDHCVTSNGSVFEDRTEAARFPQQTFVPFVSTGDEQPSVYLAFDRPLPAGLVSVYVEVSNDERVDLHEQGSLFLWEYYAESGWKGLDVRDGTLGFRRSGFLQLVGPFGAVASDGPGGSLYRVRARLKQGARLRRQAVSGLWLNAVMATDASFYGGEILADADGMPRQSVSFPPGRTPVHDGEMIEVREWTGYDRSFEAIADEVPVEDQRMVRDPVTGDVAELWIRWKRREHLFTSAPSDRAYTLERATGLLRFGDGAHGLIPPAGAPIRAAFTTGGGLAGNVPAGAITELRAALPFVASVINPRPASGGCDTEAIGITRRRGAERLRHRGQAIAARDYEWLALQASPAVARARCLSIAGPGGSGQRGWVSLVVVPNSRDRQPQPDAELKERVRGYVAARVPAAIARRVLVLGPVYQAISVVAEVVPLRPEEAGEVDAVLRKRLDLFLHPLFGGPRGEGWEVGEPVALSRVAALIESTPGVDYARDVVLQVNGSTYGDEVPGRPDALVAPGEHEIRLTLGAGQEVC